MTLSIRPAERKDVPLVADLIRQLAKFEKLEHEVVLTDDLLVAGLFGAQTKKPGHAELVVLLRPTVVTPGAFSTGSRQ